jgi:hypothetical protein
VADLNELCERQALMLSIRGDGSIRSQQTRLGNALMSNRDRIYEAWRICVVQRPGTKRGGNDYKLIPADSLSGVMEAPHTSGQSE